MRPLWVLLWKHTMMRKRSIMTLVEYLTPLISIVLIFIMTINLKEIKKNAETTTLTYADLMNQYEGSILYTPETRTTHRLMDEVGARLRLNRLDRLPGEDEMGYYPISDETSKSMLKYSKYIMRPEDAIVIFENMDSDTLPDRLNYTIRMKAMNTDYTFAQPEPDPDKPDRIGIFNLKIYNGDLGLRYESFITVQWAIDISFIHLRTGANIPKTQALQELPFDAKEGFDSGKIVPYVTAATFMPFMLAISVAFWSSRLYEEKISGLFELQKSTGVHAETILISHVLDYTPVMLVLLVCTVLFFELKGLIPHTSGGHIAFACMLYFYTLVAFALVLLYIINVGSAQYAQTCVFIVILIFWAIMIAMGGVKNRALAVFCLFFLHVPFQRFWVTLGLAEITRKGVTLSNMATSIGMPTTVLESYVFMVVQIIMFSMLAWYLSKVRPGNHGQPLPWKFLFNKLYWSKQPQVEPVQIEEDQGVDEDKKKYFENVPAHVPVAIQTINIYKAFKKEPVLLGVNLSVYRGEITMLLGHNGAGKTTLINIITGLMPPSSGRVLVKGRDLLMQSTEARKLFGLCPQHNMFFDKLSVIEHVMFFAMLKGQSYSASKVAAKELLAKLQFLIKADELPKNLSGGMKRRAQLACAVAGGSKILVLDEPTSGLDPETRRELWDLLLSFRDEHTLLMTTHFMEEADALGDRIVCIHNGKVRCHATAMFLKRAIGTGFRITLTTYESPKEADITATIISAVPEATIRDRRPNGLSYNLPSKDTAQFPDLFTAIEAKRKQLKIDTISVGKSTLDEVFLELCSDEKETYDESIATIEPKGLQFKGLKLCCRQFKALLLRQWQYLNIIVYIISIIVLSLLFLSVSFLSNNERSYTSKHNDTKDSGKVAMNLDLYGASPQRRAMVHVDNDTLSALRTGYRDINFDEIPNVAQEALRVGKGDKIFVVGVEINETSAKAHYFPSLRDAAPVALNTLTNALAVRLLRAARMRSDPDARARTITVYSYPLQGAYVPYDQKLIHLPKTKQNADLWVLLTSFFFLCYVAGLAALPIKERVSGARHAHVMAGAPRELHWAATLVAHLARSVLLVLFMTLATLVADKDKTFNQKGFAFALIMILLLGLVANLSVVYVLSTRLKQTVTAVIYLIVSYICISFSSIDSKNIGYALLLGVLYGLLPPFALAVALMKAAAVAQVNAFCNLNRGKCPLLFGPDMLDEDKCCNSPTGSEPFSYFVVNDGAGWALVFLTLQAGFYFLVTYIIDDGVWGRKVWKTGAPAEILDFVDPAVRGEYHYVEQTIQKSNKLIPDAVLCYRLKKHYPRCCSKTKLLAVRGVNFSVKEGEFFGLLGVNGAGKSTTFKMLTCETAPSSGEIFANGMRAKDEYKKYMRSMSYCPQFGGVDEFMTGRQNLTLLLMLRGLQDADVTAICDSWLKEVDLSQAADKRVSSYSGGMARRLCAAAALCQGARTAVLDEPSAGVDPLARRQMHRALMRARGNRSIIVASHNLDEMETLCNRIAIMSSGKLRALGTVASLKKEHGQGCTVVFKLSNAEGQPAAGKPSLQQLSALSEQDSKRDITNEDVVQFKAQLQKRLNCELKDHFRGILKYYVPGPIKYSELFTHLEELKEEFKVLLEDYSVTETTLEEVFLALAKEAQMQEAMSTAQNAPQQDPPKKSFESSRPTWSER